MTRMVRKELDLLVIMRRMRKRRRMTTKKNQRVERLGCPT